MTVRYYVHTYKTPSVRDVQKVLEVSGGAKSSVILLPDGKKPVIRPNHLLFPTAREAAMAVLDRQRKERRRLAAQMAALAGEISLTVEFIADGEADPAIKEKGDHPS